MGQNCVTADCGTGGAHDGVAVGDGSDDDAATSHFCNAGGKVTRLECVHCQRDFKVDRMECGREWREDRGGDQRRWNLGHGN